MQMNVEGIKCTGYLYVIPPKVEVNYFTVTSSSGSKFTASAPNIGYQPYAMVENASGSSREVEVTFSGGTYVNPAEVNKPTSKVVLKYTVTNKELKTFKPNYVRYA